MANEEKSKKEVYKVKPLTEGKKEIIASLIEEYDAPVGYRVEMSGESETVNDMKSPMDSDDELTYQYMLIETCAEMNIESIALWFKSTQDKGSLMVEAYYMNSVPPTGLFSKNEDYDLMYGKYLYKERARNPVTRKLEVTRTRVLEFDGKSTKTNKGKVKVYDLDTNGNEVTYGTYDYSFNESTRVATFYVEYTADSFGTLITYKYDYQVALDDTYENITATILDHDTSERMSSNIYNYDENFEFPSIEGIGPCLAYTRVAVTKDSWDSFTLKNWTINGASSKTFSTKEDGCIVLRFSNNCSGANKKKLTKMHFIATNLMIRAV